MEPWIETASGLHYNLASPQPDQIDIQDIALSLANKCRFSGHSQFFSVAEHSVCVAYRLPRELRLAGLLHDAAEAYLGDVPSPLKTILPDYKALEAVSEKAIEERFGLNLDWIARATIKRADMQALYTEAYYLLPSKGAGWSMFEKGVWRLEPEFQPQCVPPVVGYKMFIDAYREFTEPVVETSSKGILSYG